MATIREISKRANVSIATVSKVLNGKGGVSQATIDNVTAIAQDLNYRPNLTARSLKKGQSQTIGVITEDLTVFNTPDIVDGIDAYCELQDYHYILGQSPLQQEVRTPSAEYGRMHETRALSRRYNAF
jgi:LacI family transcriptional regulator